MATFNVTYEIVTPESAEHGESDETGFIVEGGTLRDAVKELHATRTCHVGGVESVEADSSPCVHPRSVRVVNGREFLTGAVESRTLHIPAEVSQGTARRIARLAGVKLP